LGLDRFWKLRLGLNRLTELAARLGSDVPFFLHGPSSVCTGRGEVVQPVGRPAARYAVVFRPSQALSTALVYRRFDEMGLGGSVALESQPAWSQWSKLSAERLLPLLENDLEPAAFGVAPWLGGLRDRLERLLSRPVRMSGSGSCLFTLYDDRAEAEESAGLAAARLGVAGVTAEVAVEGYEGQRVGCEGRNDRSE